MKASHVRRIASVLGLLVAWQLLVQTGRLSPLFLPAPLSVLATMWDLARSGQLPWAVLVSLNRVVQGFVYGAVLVSFVLFEPQGLYGRWLKIRTWFQMFPFYRKGMFKRQKSFQKSDRLK